LGPKLNFSSSLLGELVAFWNFPGAGTIALLGIGVGLFSPPAGRLLAGEFRCRNKPCVFKNRFLLPFLAQFGAPQENLAGKGHRFGFGENFFKAGVFEGGSLRGGLPGARSLWGPGLFYWSYYLLGPVCRPGVPPISLL